MEVFFNWIVIYLINWENPNAIFKRSTYRWIIILVNVRGVENLWNFFSIFFTWLDRAHWVTWKKNTFLIFEKPWFLCFLRKGAHVAYRCEYINYFCSVASKIIFLICHTKLREKKITVQLFFSPSILCDKLEKISTTMCRVTKLIYSYACKISTFSNEI